MRKLFEIRDEPRATFQDVMRVHLLFAACIALFVACGEVILWSGAFADIGTWKWLLRPALAVYFAYFTIYTMLFLREKRLIKGIMELRPQELDMAVARALVAVQILRTAHFTAFAVIGLTLLVLTGERLDLYAPLTLALLGLWLVRPRRKRWETVFRQAATQYPGVSETPWAAP